MAKKPIILASSSPRRKQLLKQLGLDFEVVPSKYQEDMSLRLAPDRLVKKFARGKGLEVASRQPKGIVISADTVISLGDKVLGKPHTEAVAKKTLRKISNKTINIITGYSVIDCQSKKIVTKSVITKVKIKKLTNQEINNYVKTKEPLDKAGAFGIQGLGALLVTRIEGDYFNVVGLPLYDLVKTLNKFGVNIL
ncbi:septum formation inhibitor Maf [Patescibacteria group bacterium]|nr:septum formation inhibitor Maf [Patescibacteria group bacterium]